MYNKVTLIGRCGSDAEVRYTPNQTKIASFRLATSRAWTDNTGNRQEKTEWHNIVLWGRLADRAETMITKGSLVMVDGSIEYSNWQDNDGNKRYRTDIRAQQFLMLSPKRRDGGGAYDGGGRNERTPAPSSGPEDYVDDIEIPESDFDDVPF
jgi:single-strand DNA-binding protein